MSELRLVPIGRTRAIVDINDETRPAILEMFGTVDLPGFWCTYAGAVHEGFNPFRTSYGVVEYDPDNPAHRAAVERYLADMRAFLDGPR